MHLRILEPCPRTWESLEGSGDRRYCDDCRKHVHDLTEQVPEALQERIRRGEEVCGMLPVRTTPARGPARAWAAAAFALSLAACIGHDDDMHLDAPDDELACELDPVSGLELCSLPEWWDEAADEDLVPVELARSVEVEGITLGAVSTVRGAVVHVEVDTAERPSYTVGAVATTSIMMGGITYEQRSDHLENSLMELSAEERELMARMGRGRPPAGSR